LFGDGSQRRDCLYIDDVVDAILAATDSRVAGKVLNVGNDVDHSLADIARVIVDATGGSSDIRCREWPPDHRRIDIGSFRTDSRAIAAAIDWRPSTSLDDGMRRTADFYRDHPWYLS
jgi:UDP-glucose 4-epimerase